MDSPILEFQYRSLREDTLMDLTRGDGQSPLMDLTSQDAGPLLVDLTLGGDRQAGVDLTSEKTQSQPVDLTPGDAGPLLVDLTPATPERHRTAAAHRRLYWARKAQGLCPSCGKGPPPRGLNVCYSCMTRQRTAHRRYYTRVRAMKRQGIYEAWRAR